MLKEMEERQEEEKRMEEVRKAMEIEKWEAEQNQRRIHKEKQRAEKRRQQEEEEEVPVVLKQVRRDGEDDEPQAEASGSGTRAGWNCRSCGIDCEHQLWVYLVLVNLSVC